jgi:hypothetical protein
MERGEPEPKRSVHDVIDGTLPIGLTLLGLLHPESVAAWFQSLAVSFFAVAVPVLGGAGIVHLLSMRVGRRIQGPRVKPAPIRAEAFETARCMYVVATLMAWLVTSWRLGHPLGLTWTLDEGTGGPVRVALQIVAFVCLNFYLHCGVTLRWVEATLPRLYLNTSAFHNVHHARANTHFGEALYLWDALCGTRTEAGLRPGG